MNEKQERMAAAAASGLAAISYVTQPTKWADFAAFARAQSGMDFSPEQDRLSMRLDAQLLAQLQQALEEL